MLLKAISEPVAEAVKNEQAAQLRALSASIESFRRQQSAAGQLNSGNTLVGITDRCADLVDAIAEHIVARLGEFSRANPKVAAKASAKDLKEFGRTLLSATDDPLADRVIQAVEQVRHPSPQLVLAELESRRAARRTEAMDRMETALELLSAELRRDHHVPFWRIGLARLYNIVEILALMAAVWFAYLSYRNGGTYAQTGVMAGIIALIEFLRRMTIPVLK